MKSKRGLGITLGIMCFALVFAMTIQIKTIEKSDSATLKTYREDELRTEVLKWKDKYEQVYEQFLQNETKLEEYRNVVAEEGETTSLIMQELTEANSILGLTSLRGPGIILRLDDTYANEIIPIEEEELLRTINELKGAGAEAISINGQRIITTSEIKAINVRQMVVNGETIVSPYTIKAIGKQENLESALKIKYGILEYFRSNKIVADLELSDDVIIEKYNGVIKSRYTQIAED